MEYIYNDEGNAVGARWRIAYPGYLFDGDEDFPSWNVHECEDRDEAFSIYYAYCRDLPEITVQDEYYGVAFCRDEWY